MFGIKRGSAGTDTLEAVWPEVNDLVWLRLPCCETNIHPSRVEDIVDGQLVIAAPSKPHLNPVPAPDESKVFVVGWREGSGCRQVRAGFVERNEEPVPTWTVKALSAAELLQRRRFVRASWDREVVCFLPSIEGAVHGKILDISEGGLRCEIPSANEPRNPAFEVSFELEGNLTVLAVEVAWWGEPLGDDVQIGLSFATQDAKLADRLRKHAFSLQMEERRKRNS